MAITLGSMTTQTTERLLTLKNITSEAVTLVWDSVPYTFMPGEEKTLRYGVGIFFRDQAPSALEVVGEVMGVAPDVQHHTLAVRNLGPDDVTAGWDGRTYALKAGE